MTFAFETRDTLALYEVVRYDVSEEQPGSRAHLTLVGHYRTPEDALAAARPVVDASLAEMFPRNQDAKNLYLNYLCYGEGVMVFGEPNAGFHTFEYAKWKAAQMYLPQKNDTEE